MKYRKPSEVYCGLARVASRLVAALCFRRNFLRNESRNEKKLFGTVVWR